MAPRINVPATRELYSDLFKASGEVKSNSKLAERNESFVDEMSKSTYDGLTGQTFIDGEGVAGVPIVKSRAKAASQLRDSAQRAGFTKGLSNFSVAAGNTGQYAQMMKEWTLTSPIPSGLVPYDLEAPSKLLVPRPTPIRNTTPRVKGQGAARKFKVISGFTGSGTGGVTTLQPGINESTLNAGPGALNLIRPPYMSYNGYDITLNYVAWGLSDSVSFQAEYQGAGFEDIRSLSNTALLYATMLLDERMMLYGRGVTANGYTGSLGVPTITSCTAVNASVTPNGTSTLGNSATVWVIVAADAGDLLGTNGGMHQGPSTTVGTTASVTTSAGLTAVQVNIGNDVAGALGYNIYAASVQAGPYYLAGRTGYNVGYITSQPSSGPTTTSGAADASAVSNNFDGLLTNVAASGGYVKRLNGPLSVTNPGVEVQTALASLYEAVKADPEEVWMNGFDRLQLSNCLLNNAAVNAYRVYISDSPTGPGGVGQAAVGTVVQTLLNQVTGSALSINLEPFMPQGNILIRSKTLPMPDSNISETSVMVMPCDYLALQWPQIQLTYDVSTFEIGTFCHYAPAWSALIQGVQGVAISNLPSDDSDS